MRNQARLILAGIILIIMVFIAMGLSSCSPKILRQPKPTHAEKKLTRLLIKHPELVKTTTDTITKVSTIALHDSLTPTITSSIDLDSLKESLGKDTVLVPVPIVKKLIQYVHDKSQLSIDTVIRRIVDYGDTMRADYSLHLYTMNGKLFMDPMINVTTSFKYDQQVVTPVPKGNSTFHCIFYWTGIVVWLVFLGTMIIWFLDTKTSVIKRLMP